MTLEIKRGINNVYEPTEEFAPCGFNYIIIRATVSRR